MDIAIKDSEFRIKGKTGVLNTTPRGVIITSSDGLNSKELIGTGEYEVSGISVLSMPVADGSVSIYEVDGIRICNLAGVNKKLEEGKISQIGDIDIVLLPINDLTKEIYQQIESYFIIPFGFSNQEQLDNFLRESGMMVQKLPKFVIKRDELPPNGDEESPTQIILLETRN